MGYFLSFFPAVLILQFAGLERGEEPLAGQKSSA
jgi:hypothetical protein